MPFPKAPLYSGQQHDIEQRMKGLERIQELSCNASKIDKTGMTMSTLYIHQ